jgi:hypothetical protein
MLMEELAATIMLVIPAIQKMVMVEMAALQIMGAEYHVAASLAALASVSFREDLVVLKMITIMLLPLTVMEELAAK